MLLELQERTEFGKGSAKKLRKNGFTPVVVSSVELGSVCASISSKVLFKLIENPSFLNTLFQVQVGNKKIDVVAKKVEFDPLTSKPIHVDFIHNSTKTVVVPVPIKILGMDVSVGLKRGGKMNVISYSIPISASTNKIPPFIEVDISKFGIGRSIFAAALKLPDGCSLVKDCLVLSIIGRGKQDKGEEASAA